MNIQFLFGAGASYDGTTATPPLGKNLYSELASVSDNWRDLPKDITDDFASSAQTFEATMARLHSEHLNLVPTLMRDLALFFLSYRPRRSCGYRNLIDKLERWNSPISVQFFTLNYDLLLDACLAEFDPSCRVFKLHGAPNFLPNLDQISGTPQISGYRVAVSVPIDVLSPEQARERLKAAKGGDLCAPAMAIYAPGKHILHCPDQILELQKAWANSLDEHDIIYVIGMSVALQDTHIWEPLAKARGRIEFVNPGAGDVESFETWAQLNRPPNMSATHQQTFIEFIKSFSITVE
jgi:hypothetical protein